MCSYKTLIQNAADDKASAIRALDCLQSDLLKRGSRDVGPDSSPGLPDSATNSNYFARRSRLIQDSRDLDFDSRCRVSAGPVEQRADSIIRKLRRRDLEDVYGSSSPRQGHSGQRHPRIEGDHFLSNKHLIDQTKVFGVLRRMPKGAHLHVHFNACLPPNILLGIAKGMDRMFISSNLTLWTDTDGDFAGYDACELQFSILAPDGEDPGDLFSPEYRPRQTMRLDDFLRQFPRHYPRLGPEAWLEEKLLFREEEAHGVLQTAAGAWEKFNARTRMMKGLFNYETAFRTYTRLFLEDLMRDHIQYAEVRPTFMESNLLFTDDGRRRIDSRGMLRIIVDETTRFKREMALKGRFFGGVKVIYTAPRSFPPQAIKKSLDDCLQLKHEFPDLIAGFDLAGEEAKGRPLRDFVPQFLSFQETCKATGQHIPFLFHCGETLDLGTDVDGNIVDALLLGAERIGHAFALPRHPRTMQEFKARGVCVEVCPISNEVLGLTPRIAGHSIYTLLANNVHCTVNSDNGALFGSTLSHDFYQVLVGRADFSLYGLKQLALWSIEHACLGEGEKKALLKEWTLDWHRWLQWVVEKYDAVE